MLTAMRRGVNLPGWDLDDASRRPTIAQLQALRERGFTHIRLLLDNERLGQDTYLDLMVEQVVLLMSLDYAVSLDLHAGSAIGKMFARDPAEAEAYLADLWLAIAKRVRSFDPKKLAVELLNEPELDQATWHAAAGRLIATIRRVLLDTTIVVGPAGPQRHEELAGLGLFDDDNIVYAVHYYDPFAFTHQGADWGGAGDPLQFLKDLPFPATESDKAMRDRIAALKAAGHTEAADVVARSLETPWTVEATIVPAFAMMADWSRENARPVIVNEFGVLSWVAPREARLDWLAAVRTAAEANCIGWAHWDFQDGFGLMDDKTGMPDESVMGALAPESR